MITTLLISLSGCILLFLCIWGVTVTMPTELLAKNFPEDGHIPLVLLFIEGGNSQLEAGDEIADMVHIAAADYGRVALGWIQPPPEFGKVSEVHDPVRPFIG